VAELGRAAVPVGVIGVGNISDTYLENLRSSYSPFVEVIGCADVIPERARAAATRWALPRTYESVDDLLADEQIRVVLVLTTPASHFEVCSAAVSAGKHVFVEKPISVSVDQASALVEHAAQVGVSIAVAPDTCLGTALQLALQVVEDGRIGEPIAASANMLCHGHEKWHPNPAFFYEPGAGPLMDMGPYYLSALLGLMGSVESVQASSQASFGQREVSSEPLKGTWIDVHVPTHVASTMRFERGGIATMVTSFDVWASQAPHLEIYGSSGTLVLPNPNWYDGQVLLWQVAGQEWVSLSPPVSANIDRRGLGLVDFVEAIAAGAQPRLDASLGLHILDIMESIGVSAKTDCLVPVSSRLSGPPLLQA
ncbi:MAG: Gfo/Idh/MocA family oxidoreductase, partial [Gammaproteobacteria bacterium]|nr:Gfo/Idh/MocA family oxidoreductase [Gammaproteobacteria bacterium]